MRRCVLAFFLLIVCHPLVAVTAASRLDLDGHFVQGGLVTGRAPTGTRVWFDGQPVRVSGDGVFLVGFGRDFKPLVMLEARFPDGARERRELQIAPREYAVQRIDGLPPKMVTPGPKSLKRIRREARLIKAVRAQDTPETWFARGFVWPLEGRITGVFGSQRILNGEPRRPHFGIDIAAPEGAPVLAPNDGRVALAEADLYFTGGTVMLDHGHGLTSVYSHLGTVEVRVDEQVARGKRIGTVGATGRATGPHLDWRVNWFGERLDPALLAGPMPD